VNLADVFAPEVVKLLEELIDARVREASAKQDGKPWLTVREASVYLGCSEVALRRRIARGRVPVKRQGRSILIDRLLLDRELEKG
jgi:excisionase family DNA binding protein